MELPTEPKRCLAIAMLRAIGINQKDAAKYTRCANQTVVDAEKWFREEDYHRVARICDDQSIKKMVAAEAIYWGLEEEDLVRLDRLTQDDIFRHYRADYLGTVIEQKPLALSAPLPTFNIGDLKIAPSPIGTKLMEIGPPMKPLKPPLPAYADISIRLHVENPSDASITISGISYKVTINGNYAGTGSVTGAYTIPPHSEVEIDSPFRADFNTGGSVVISAIISKELQIGLTGTAHYQSNSHRADKPFSGVISVTLQLPFHLP